MSETIDLPSPVVVPPVQRMSSADINELGPWLFPRLRDHWQTTDHHVRGWLTGALPSNEQALIRCGDVVGMAHVEPGRMGHLARVVVDFAISERASLAAQDEFEQVFRWFARWAHGHQACGLFGVDDFTDIDKTFIRSWLGKLTKRESFGVMF